MVSFVACLVEGYTVDYHIFELSLDLIYCPWLENWYWTGHVDIHFYCSILCMHILVIFGWFWILHDEIFLGCGFMVLYSLWILIHWFVIIPRNILITPICCWWCNALHTFLFSVLWNTLLWLSREDYLAYYICNHRIRLDSLHLLIIIMYHLFVLMFIIYLWIYYVYRFPFLAGMIDIDHHHFVVEVSGILNSTTRNSFWG